MPGMLNDLLLWLRGTQHPTPSQLYDKQYPSYFDKTKTKMQGHEFLAKPVTDTERQILGLAPPGMLRELNRQALDRELNSIRFWNAVQQSKPKSI